MSTDGADGLAADFARIGLAEAKIKEVLKNKQVAAALAEVAREAGFAEKPTLLHHLALASRNASVDEKADRSLVAVAIGDGRLATTAQVDAAWNYVATTTGPTADGLDAASGVGVVVTEEDVAKEVRAFIEQHRPVIEEERYRSIPSILVAIKKLPSMRWANPALFKPLIDRELLALLGPKDERDDLKAKAKKDKEAAKAAKDAKDPKGAKDAKDAKGAKAAPAAAESAAHGNMFNEGFLAHLHKPGENKQKDPRRMEEHIAATHGDVVTRFPPEPNGFLHIGHAKAIAINFGYAAYNKGRCFLRFDDTNPEAEDDVYAKSILEIVKWMGFTPYDITWSSDYFDQLYELAEVLIRNDAAYTCNCTAEQMKINRGIREDGTPGGPRKACPHRSQSVDENLKQFREMRDGKYGKGEITLRMKQDLENPNPQMWDLVAYRVMDAPHHRLGTKWKIYPTYDFTHCLVDSMENISHSLCTLEFRLSRESYEWLCDAVDVYKPAQREFGRLNLIGSVMSKRKLLKLVEGKYVRGWDDPRLYTLVALRRRGIPPGAILSFISELGVTTATTQIEIARFDVAIRKYLENTVPRLMMIPDPVKVIIDNLPDDHHEYIDLPFKPGTPAMGDHKVPFTKVVYVDRSDFREVPDANYFRLAPGQSVGLLRVPYTINVTSFNKDESGKVVEIHAHYENEGKPKKPKTFIQWVAESPKDNSPIKIGEIREFDRLFKSDNPSTHPDGYLADLNPASENRISTAIIEVGFEEVRAKSPWRITASGGDAGDEILQGADEKGAPESVRFQALRVGYYALDKDTTDSFSVLNRVVTLKEDKGR